VFCGDNLKWILKNDWPNDGLARPHIAKYLKTTGGAVAETDSVKQQYKTQVTNLMGYYTKLNEDNANPGRALQIDLLEVLLKDLDE
jgi:hypothetical protein